MSSPFPSPPLALLSPPFLPSLSLSLSRLRLHHPFFTQALYASKIVSYAQGFMLLREAAKGYGWKLNYGSIALMWRGGCIIRSRFLGNIKTAFDKNPELTCLLLDDFFRKAIEDCQVWGGDVRACVFVECVSFLEVVTYIRVSVTLCV